MGIIVGSLAGQNWHRQTNQRGLEGRARFEYGLEKTAAIAREFGFSPLSLDFGLAVVGADRGYLRELRARLRENDLIPTVGFGSVAVSNDAWVRQQSLEQARTNLELVAEIGATLSTFGCARNGRVTRAGQIRIATQMLTEIGRVAGELGLRITQENFDYFTAEELVRISAGTGRDNVGIHSDTGNWLITGEDPVEATRHCLPYTYHAHVRDYVLENDTYNGVAVGEGLVDFDRVLPLLAQCGAERDIIFTVEVDTDDRDEDACAHTSFAYVKNWLVRNGHTTYIRQ